MTEEPDITTTKDTDNKIEKAKKIASLKQEILDGKYVINSEHIAKKIVEKDKKD